MPTLDVISVNIWQILISLINLVLLFLILKKFLFKPVKRIMSQRQSELDEKYVAAALAQAKAEESQERWESTLSTANEKADAILEEASEQAKRRGEKLLEEAKERADSILRNAQAEAELERQKATDEIKKEIVDLSEELAKKMLEREINTEDHRAMIDSFIDQIGDSDE